MSHAPRWTVEGADWPNRVASRFVATGRITWHLQELGPATEGAPVMLLLHGTGAATHSWRRLAPLLAEQFTVVAPDLPGHGFTTGRPVGGLGLPAMARAVAELLTAVDRRPALIVGHSAGAAIAIRMVLDGLATPRALVGLNAALLPFPGLGARLFPTLAKLLFVNPFAPIAFSRIARQPGEVARFLPRATGSRIDAAGVDFYRRLFATSAHCAGAIGMMADWDLAGLQRDLPRLETPLLLLHGAADSAIPSATVQAAARLAPHAKVELLPRLGHLAHEEQPALIAERIAAFAAEQGVR